MAGFAKHGVHSNGLQNVAVQEVCHRECIVVVQDRCVNRTAKANQEWACLKHDFSSAVKKFDANI
jgi:hypothetical protein